MKATDEGAQPLCSACRTRAFALGLCYALNRGDLEGTAGIVSHLLKIYDYLVEVPAKVSYFEYGATNLNLIELSATNLDLLAFTLAKRTTRHWGTKMVILAAVYAGEVL